MNPGDLFIQQSSCPEPSHRMSVCPYWYINLHGADRSFHLNLLQRRLIQKPKKEVDKGEFVSFAIISGLANTTVNCR